MIHGNVMIQTLAIWIIIQLVNIGSTLGETVQVCNGEDFRLTCSQNEIIKTTSAEYGRKEVGRCISEADDFMGCTNDILPLLDRWCSGRRECSFSVPNEDLEKRNKDCLKILRLYVRVTYICMEIDSRCQSNGPNTRTDSIGYLTSHLADTKSCGLQGSPWILSASPGQTISLTLTDFSSNSQTSNLISCPIVYGYVHERALGINHNICGGRRREEVLYTSKTNSIEIYFRPKIERNRGQFIIEYTVTGCPELPRPAHAWYKREGNEAAIGCETNDREWRLTCTGNTWVGEVGNCTDIVVVSPPVKTTNLNIQVSSVVVMTGIAGGAVVLCVIVIVIGAVYINKYRMRQETKHMQKTYSTLERDAQSYYGHRFMTLDPSNQSTVGTWDMSREQMLAYRDQCACATLPARSDVNMPPGGAVDERHSLYNSINST